MNKLPRVKATKRCTKCGSPGPFGITSHRGTAYYRSQCVECLRINSRARHRRYRVTHGAELRHYHTRHQRERRLTLRLLAYAEKPTRVVANYIGRHSCSSGYKWCSYGQHMVRATRTFFWRSPATKDGLMHNCKACRRISNKVSYYKKQRAVIR